MLAGTAQMDEAYFKNLSLLMAKQIGSNKLAYQVIFKRSVDKTEAITFIHQTVQPRSRLQTDGSGIYKGVERWWQVKHRVDIHKRFEFGLIFAEYTITPPLPTCRNT